jgi:hypothetical protein
MSPEALAAFLDAKHLAPPLTATMVASLDRVR